MNQHHREDSEKEEQEGEDGRPLTISERKAVRRIIENEHRIQWFWGSVRVWAAWVSGILLGVAAVMEIIGRLTKH